MLEFKFYRHKEYKDIFLTTCFRRPSITEELDIAIHNFKDTDMIVKESAKEIHTTYQIKRKFEIDGFKGTLTKEIPLQLSDFEIITLREVENDSL